MANQEVEQRKTSDDDIILEWREGKKAPREMHRPNDAVVDGNMVYFRAAKTRRIYAYNSKNITWTELPECKSESEWCALAVINNLLTTIGGIETNKLFSLPREGQRREWTEVFKPMPMKRSCSAVANTGKALIVAGGKDKNRKRLTTVEIMDIETQVWSSASDIPKPLHEASVTICNHRIYIVGGYDDDCDGLSKSVYTCTLFKLFQSCTSKSQERLAQSLDLSLTPEENTTNTSTNGSTNGIWTRVADLPVKRSASLAFHGRLLAIGGCDSEDAPPISDIYIYNPTSKTWKVISQIKMSRSSCFAVVLPTNEIMVMGGYITSTESETDSVEIGMHIQHCTPEPSNVRTFINLQIEVDAQKSQLAEDKQALQDAYKDGDKDVNKDVDVYSNKDELAAQTSLLNVKADTESLAIKVPHSFTDFEAVTTGTINLYTPPVISQYLYSAEKVAHVPFIGPVVVVTCDHHGRQFKNEEHDITVTIPEGAIPEGLIVHFELAVAIIGPFYFTGSRRPISPILWMCPQESFQFQKPFTITLPHFLTEASPKDLENVVVSKATEYCFTEVDGERLYNFRTHPDLNRPRFFSKDGVNYGSFETTHCCLYCLEDKKWTRAEMLKAGYFLHVVNAPQTVYFYITFYLSSCTKAIKEKHSDKKFKVQKPVKLQLDPQMDGSDTGPHIQIMLDEQLTSGIIKMIPTNGMIKASEVDFWDCSESLLRHYHDTDDYPPKIELRLKKFTPQLNIKGCSEEGEVLSKIESHLEFSIESFPSPMKFKQAGWIVNYTDTCNEEEDIASTLLTIDDTPLDCDDDWDDIVEILKELSGEWNDVGRKLHIKNSTLRALDSDYPKDCSRCLSEVVYEWLQKNYNVTRFGEPSWRHLAQVVSKLNMKVFNNIAEQHKTK